MNNNSQLVENKVSSILYEKVVQLSSEFSKSKLKTPLDRQKIQVILNELKYEAHKVRNLRFVR